VSFCELHHKNIVILLEELAQLLYSLEENGFLEGLLGRKQDQFFSETAQFKVYIPVARDTELHRLRNVVSLELSLQFFTV
jgi:hypothetical protein